ncbi:unnamed protein product, partial [Urochloa humidicola]
KATISASRSFHSSSSETGGACSSVEQLHAAAASQAGDGPVALPAPLVRRCCSHPARRRGRQIPHCHFPRRSRHWTACSVTVAACIPAAFAALEGTGSGRCEPPSPPRDCGLGKRGAGVAGAAGGLSGSGAAAWSQDWAGARCSKACPQIRERSILQTSWVLRGSLLTAPVDFTIIVSNQWQPPPSRVNMHKVTMSIMACLAIHYLQRSLQ